MGVALAFALSLVVARDALAYCVATTCDPKHEQCATRPDGCVVDGAPLHWESRCLSFGVQKDGSPRREITYQSADEIIRTAFRQWMNADCPGGHPSFQIWDISAPYGGMVCGTPEFNSLRPNANVWMFRDNDWPYEGENSTLALTSTIFEKSSGALLDADVEINSYANTLTTTSVATGVGKDLQSIVTHEAGHFLGLGHSTVPQATMFAQYSAGDLNYRSLHPDDEAAICSLYPPDRDSPACKSPSPAHGFSLYCGGGDDDGTASVSGCSAAAPGGGLGSPFAALVAGAALAGIAFVRRRR
jgi:MYXO-CTERM domain-containing protein